ncbi:anti-sigma-F factor Fin family protein [Alkalihalobacillus pseudalcaliphilus]|uniref:anti-sigma-F factor Fin family protein n=1 Tax=Alkalihalobacillus pseudalcaliphilus TaxID=79884 RepID=UPI00064DC9AE|nr:anti-sigma-F factor Fin family protein [Alkalihalobacillus pseudalcaliphilus]KMK74489.1 peptide ABC transporter permease [Alkalihalobacillus pseudalcaliphilus]
MAIVYQCSHCCLVVGRIEQQSINSSELGFDRLNTEEREAAISYQNNGDIHVQAICDDCYDALALNPSFHEIDTFIQ